MKVFVGEQKKIELGQKVMDTLTGYQGIVIGRTEWLFGCVRVGVQTYGLTKDGKPMDAAWFDEGQVKVITVENEVPVEPTEVKKLAAVSTGGPRDSETGLRSDDDLFDQLFDNR